MPRPTRPNTAGGRVVALTTGHTVVSASALGWIRYSKSISQLPANVDDSKRRRERTLSTTSHVDGYASDDNDHDMQIGLRSRPLSRINSLSGVGGYSSLEDPRPHTRSSARRQLKAN